MNPLYAAGGTDLHFPYRSPLGDLLTVNQLNVRGAEFKRKTLDTIGSHRLTTHNMLAYVRSFLEANELTFMHKSEADKAVPQKLLDTCAFIDDILGEERWQAKLKKEKLLLADVFSKKTLKDIVEEDELR